MENTISYIDNFIKNLSKEIDEEVEIDINIFTDKNKSSKIKKHFLDEAKRLDINAEINFDNKDWISLSIGSLDISIWHN